MHLRPDDLSGHLASGLAPVYLIAGEEPLLLGEAADAVRAAARERGFTEREVLEVEKGFDWGRLGEAASNLSLFGERRILELRVPGGKPGKPGSQALKDYCRSAPADTLLLISTDRLDYRQRQSAWVEACERAGAFLYCWPVRVNELPGWVASRMRSRGLEPSREAVALLSQRAEGNLLAAAQEIDKLALLHESGPLDVEEVRSAVADSARFDVFDLTDAALAGQPARVLRILQGLREEGVEPTLVLWALTQDLRVLAALGAVGRSRGNPADVLGKFRVFKARRPGFQRAAGASRPGVWESLLGRCARVDRAVKGVGEGRPWDELLQLALAYARAAAGSA